MEDRLSEGATRMSPVPGGLVNSPSTQTEPPMPDCRICELEPVSLEGDACWQCAGDAALAWKAAKMAPPMTAADVRQLKSQAKRVVAQAEVREKAEARGYTFGDG